MKTKKVWMESKDFTELSEILKASSHPSRMAIIFLLCNSNDKKMTIERIYMELKMPRPIISRHLSILKNIDLIQRVSEGINTFYRLNEKNKYAKQLSNCFLSLK